MFDPFVHGVNFKVSHPQFLILLSVRNEKKYGYEILKDLDDSFEGLWEPKTGTIYPAIKKLQENGLLVSEMVDDKEHYRLSGTGREFLIQVLPGLGRMVALSAKVTAMVETARKEFGLEALSFETICGPDKEDKLRILEDMREHLESGLIKINEAIEKIKEGSEWET